MVVFVIVIGHGRTTGIALQTATVPGVGRSPKTRRRLHPMASS